jgi:hypothetical protein
LILVAVKDGVEAEAEAGVGVAEVVVEVAVAVAVEAVDWDQTEERVEVLRLLNQATTEM